MKFSQIYNIFIGVFLICFLFAGIGFLLAYLGMPKLGWKIGFAGAAIGNLIVIAFWLMKWFKFDDK